MKTVIGIDYSMISPAITVMPESGKFADCSCYYLTDKRTLIGKFGNCFGTEHRLWSTKEQRFDQISDWALDIVKLWDYPLVFIEDYSLGSRGRTFEIAENTGLLKHKLYKENAEFKLVPPTVVKKFFTGKGNSDKPAMVKQFTLLTGVDLEKIMTPNKKLGSPVTDIVDSYAIARLALDFTEKPS